LTGVQISFENYSDRMDKWFKITAYSPEKRFFVTIFEDITDRKKSEALLIEREERYKRLLSSTTGYVYTVFIENGFVTRTVHGPGCEAISGYSPEDFSSDPDLWFKVIYPDDREQVVTFVTAAVEGNFYQSMEHRIIRKDGSTVWVRNTPVPHYNEHKILIEYDGIITDITERKMAELSLRESEELFSKAFFYGPLVMTISDFETGKFIQVNDNFCRLSGYSRDEVIGKTSVEIGLFPNIEERTSFAENISNSGQIKDREMTFWKKNGDYGTFLYFGECITVQGSRQIFSILEDITYKKKVEYKLRENEELLWNIINSSPDYIYFKDTDLRIVLCNERYAEAMNKKPPELFGKTDIENGWDPELVKGNPEKGITGFENDDLSALQGNTVVSENKPARLGGSIRYFNTIRIPLYKKGRILGLLGISRDITEKKTADQERDATINLLKIINSSDNLQDLMKTIIIYLRNWSGCEAVGIRLRDGEDYPFYESAGFQEEFLMTENSLCTYDLKGQLKRDDAGNAVLDCMCGNIICGRFDVGKEFFTPGGSFWTNSTTDLLASTSEEDRQSRTRNRCNGMGYESVALIPLRTGERTFGLIQLNNREKGRFTRELVELFERLAENVALSLSEKIMKNVLSESESRFRNLFEHIPVAYLSFDSLGFILDVNDNWLRILGYDREDVIGRSFGGFWAEKSNDLFYENLKSFFRNKIIDIPELQLLKKNGEIITAILSGRVQSGSKGEIEKTHCVIIDISERKIAEDILREREEFISGVLNSLSAHIAVLDEKGYIVAVNEAWRRFLIQNGVADDHSYLGENYLAVCKKAFELYGDSLAEQVYEGIKSVMRGGDDIFSIEYPCHAPNEERWFKALVTRFTARKPYHFVVAHENITERKKAEEEIQSLLKEKEILLREVHHRIKNNMNTISGLLMLQAGSITDQAAISALNDARSRVQSMMIMYDKLYRSEDYRKMSVKDYLEKFIDEIFVIFENSRNVIIQKDIEEFILDTKLLFPLGIIINELITNAFKYAFPGGRRGMIKVAVRKDGDIITLIIQDDGVGFPEDSAFPKRGGFGLNLVSALTEQISGQFSITGENGTTAEILFNRKG
jgi:PAS domain S-box-containing protein